MNISIIPIPSLAAAMLAAAACCAEPAPPFMIAEGPDWVRIDYRKDIIPGSAMDFSAFSGDAPAGSFGWLRRAGGHFEFEGRPGESVRFYGANLCYSACWPEREEADRLVARLKATGYNSVRLHHHDNGLTLGGNGPSDFNAENLDRFDSLVATAIKAGLYVTTDLYVSRRVKWRDIGFDRDGDVPMAVFKALVAFWEPAYRNWEAYATAFLEHVNPYTGRRYADEPGMPLLAMVNEGCYRINWKEIAELPCVREAWDKWVAAKLAEDPMFAGGEDLSDPSLLKWNKEGRFTHTALATFLGEMEERAYARELDAMRGIGAKALFTSLNHLPHHAPAHATRQKLYDYFDDHCYVDHPYWPKQSWNLPAGLKNLNPLLDPEFRLPKHAFHRLWGMPATMSEWNFCGPNQWRGMGGLLTGAMAAGQDWSGVWRFAYMHGRDAFRDGAGEPGFFDVAKDPIAMLAERTVVPLYLRGDFRALPQKISLVLDEKAQRPQSAQMPAFFPEWRAEAVWRAQVGVAFPETPEPGAEAFDLTSVMDAPAPPLALSDPPQMRVDLAAGTFAVETPLTCGGFATNGTICAGALTARIVRGGPTAVAATSLDGRPLAESARILVTHLTDAQAEGRIFQDETRKRLLDWGRQPILIRDGEAEISLMLDCSQIFNVHKSSLSKNINDKRSGYNALGELGLPIDGNEDLELVDNPAEWRVYALGTDGKREGIVESRLDGGRLSFTARIRGPHGACMAYEVVDEQRRSLLSTPNPSVRLSVVQDAPGYNSWPMIATIGNKIVCTYGRGLGHSMEGSRGAYARTSLDGGATWSSEICIANDPVVCEGVEGVGNDEDGAMLCWMNCRLRRKGHILHDLYRTEDGVSYEKIASPDLSPEPVQITGIFSVPGVGLMSLWFSGLYGNRKDGHAWGTLVSEDNGRTWRQRTIEENLPKAEWPTEISCVPVGGSRLFAIARREGRAPCQFQLTSLDGGKTWRKSLTNITDVRESTPALLFDPDTGLVSNYYYQRGPGLLWRRTARLESVFDEAGAWPDPEPIARGGRIRPHDSGNVTAVACGEFHHLAYYSGNPADTSVLVATVPKGQAPLLRFGVVSDTHVRLAPGGESLDPYCGTETLETALEWFRDQCVDAVIAGDLTDCGLRGELKAVADTWFKVFPADRAPDGRKVERIFILGNHDAYGTRLGGKVFKDEEVLKRESIQTDPQGVWRECFHEDFEPFFVKSVKGHDFFCVHWAFGVWCNGFAEKASHGGEDWFKGEIAKRNSQKPFFFVQHSHPRDTVYGVNAWGKDDGAATRLLADFPNAIAFSGHSHEPLSNEKAIWLGNFTSVATGSLRYLSASSVWNFEHQPGYENGVCNVYFKGVTESERASVRARFDAPKTMADTTRRNDIRVGMLVDVYADRVEFTKRDFVSGLPIGAPWAVPVPFRPNPFEARAAAATPPQFPAGAVLAVSSGKAVTRGLKSASLAVPQESKAALFLDFPAATLGGTVAEYEISAEGLDGAHFETRTCAIGGLYPRSSPKFGKPESAVIALDRLPVGAKTVRVTPLDSFGNRGRPLESAIDLAPL